MPVHFTAPPCTYCYLRFLNSNTATNIFHVHPHTPLPSTCPQGLIYPKTSRVSSLLLTSKERLLVPHLSPPLSPTPRPPYTTLITTPLRSAQHPPAIHAPIRSRLVV